jgi:hypothetical protein
MSSNTVRQALSIEFCDIWTKVPPEKPFSMGRDADLVIDDNPYLHRRFLELHHRDGMWWLANVGQHLTATVSDLDSAAHAWLAPGAQLPVVFPLSVVRFAAGPTSYELSLHLADPPFVPLPNGAGGVGGTTTRTPVTLTPEQRLLILALAEPGLRTPGSGTTILPTSASAAQRLGWPITRFNRKLDYLCHRLERAGIPGLHGDAEQLASGRRARLVHYAMATRLVSIDDLPLLDAPAGPPEPGA